MSRRHYNLPPLTMLATFEAAARNNSFKIAAVELNVTAGAVSHQIKALEAHLGRPLFARVHRGVMLTEDGEALRYTLGRAFHTVSQTLSDISSQAADRSITISATTAVSSLWLTPRITRFWRDYPHIEINQTVSDTPPLHGTHYDLRIQYGRDSLSDTGSMQLFQDTLVPIAAPQIAQTLHGCDLTALAQSSLIHTKAEDARWTTWTRWFSDLGNSGPLRRGMVVNNYMIALQAAQDGAGVVLGWRHLVKPFLDNGSLCVIDGHTLPAPNSFHVIRTADSIGDARIDLLTDWLLFSDEFNSPQTQEN